MQITCDGSQVWKISEVVSLPHQCILMLLIYIAKIGKIVKNKILASTTILSFLGS